MSSRLRWNRRIDIVARDSQSLCALVAFVTVYCELWCVFAIREIPDDPSYLLISAEVRLVVPAKVRIRSLWLGDSAARNESHWMISRWLLKSTSR